jgi:hypothetical protein
MKKVPTRRPRARVVRDEEPLPEYDFRDGVRGKYAAAYAQGTNLILLDPDVAAVFPDAATVNEALRALMVIARLQKHPDAPVSPVRKPASPRRQPHST